MKRHLTVLAMLVGAMSFVPSHAGTATSSFFGACDLLVVVSGSYRDTTSSIEGGGTCSGMLDGVAVTDAEITLSGHEDGLTFVLPILYNGFSTMTFVESGVVFPVRFSVLVNVLEVVGWCETCGGGALGVAEVFTPGPAPEDPDAREVNVRVVAVTYDPLTN